MKNKYIATAISLLITTLVTGQVNVENKTQTKADAIVFSKSETEYRQVQKELQQLEQQKKQLLTLMELYNEKQKKLLPRIEKLENNYDSITKTDIPAAAGGSSQNELLNATKQMQETQMSFNLQYLQLQINMQNENRSYTAISNIMKTKHDTVKNSISNVR
jgi:uncharacterized glyoxalase superfamily metalloenzyme YdcJ